MPGSVSIVGRDIRPFARWIGKGEDDFYTPGFYEFGFYACRHQVLLLVTQCRYCNGHPVHSEFTDDFTSPGIELLPGVFDIGDSCDPMIIGHDLQPKVA